LQVKVGIIVYSQTGNTRAVADVLREKLEGAGHEPHIEDVVPDGEVHPGKKDVEYSSAPDVGPYEALVVAAPVQAFSLSVGMKAYLSQLEAGAMSGKQAVCFVTKQLPGKWTGGNRAIRQMRKLCEEKGASVIGSEIIVWSSRKREQMVREGGERIAGLF
jgi:flavodoxin